MNWIIANVAEHNQLLIYVLIKYYLLTLIFQVGQPRILCRGQSSVLLQTLKADAWNIQASDPKNKGERFLQGYHRGLKSAYQFRLGTILKVLKYSPYTFKVRSLGSLTNVESLSILIMIKRLIFTVIYSISKFLFNVFKVPLKLSWKFILNSTKLPITQFQFQLRFVVIQ